MRIATALPPADQRTFLRAIYGAGPRAPELSAFFACAPEVRYDVLAGRTSAGDPDLAAVALQVALRTEGPRETAAYRIARLGTSGFALQGRTPEVAVRLRRSAADRLNALSRRPQPDDETARRLAVAVGEILEYAETAGADAESDATRDLACARAGCESSEVLVRMGPDALAASLHELSECDAAAPLVRRTAEALLDPRVPFDPATRRAALHGYLALPAEPGGLTAPGRLRTLFVGPWPFPNAWRDELFSEAAAEFVRWDPATREHIFNAILHVDSPFSERARAAALGGLGDAELDCSSGALGVPQRQAIVRLALDRPPTYPAAMHVAALGLLNDEFAQYRREIFRGDDEARFLGHLLNDDPERHSAYTPHERGRAALTVTTQDFFDDEECPVHCKAGGLRERVARAALRNAAFDEPARASVLALLGGRPETVADVHADLPRLRRDAAIARTLGEICALRPDRTELLQIARVLVTLDLTPHDREAVRRRLARAGEAPFGRNSRRP